MGPGCGLYRIIPVVRTRRARPLVRFLSMIGPGKSCEHEGRVPIGPREEKPMTIDERRSPPWTPTASSLPPSGSASRHRTTARHGMLQSRAPALPLFPALLTIMSEYGALDRVPAARSWSRRSRSSSSRPPSCAPRDARSSTSFIQLAPGSTISGFADWRNTSRTWARLHDARSSARSTGFLVNGDLMCTSLGSITRARRSCPVRGDQPARALRLAHRSCVRLLSFPEEASASPSA